jgi:hypothetical protein
MIKRIGIYLNEMFPLSAFLGSMLTALAIQLTYLRLFEVIPVSAIHLLVPGLVITLVSLLIRIMDEFKDYQDDLTNFPDRPLPSGRVNKNDLKILAGVCVAGILLLSLSSVMLFVWATFTLAFTYLMLKWFFVEERMRKNLPLAFITHHPIVLFNFIYLLIACAQLSKKINLSKAYFILPICLIFTNWEVVRKIRAPEQETAYTTYSKIFGPRPAIIIALVLQLIFTGTVYLIFNELGTGLIIQIVFGILQLVLMVPSFYFLISLKLPKPLKPVAEAQILLVVIAILVASLI